MMKLTKTLAVMLCGLAVLTACSHHNYEWQPQTEHTDYAQALALAPDGDGGVYLLTSGWADGQGAGDYRFALADDDAGAALQALMQQGHIRDTLPTHTCVVRLYALTGSRPQPVSAYLELYFPPALFAGAPRPSAIRQPSRDYPVSAQVRRAAAQRGFALPAQGRLPYLQVRLTQGRAVQLSDAVRTELLRRHALHATVSACRDRQRLKRQVVGRESWLKIM